MENVIDNSGCAENQKVKYAASSFVNKALTWWNTQGQTRGREAAIGMSWTDFKALLVEEFCPSNEMEKLESELACGTLTKVVVEETKKQGGWGNDNKRAKVAPIIAVRGEHKPGTCYECGSRKHFRNTYPKLTRAPGQVGNRLTIEGNRNTRNSENQVKGRAFNVNAVSALQDPNVVTGNFSLNNHYATVLFDSGADFSFISTNFAPLLNVKPSFVNPRYVIEVADGHGSFDVIVGMDWMSKHKAEIVCHEKVVRIPFESGEILHVQGERIPGIAKALSNVKDFHCNDKLSSARIFSFPEQTTVAKYPIVNALEMQRYCSWQASRVELNKLTVKNRYPLPRIDDLFD
ncbi:putative reverse transcriptase domain-containing protein [Tanacetum coccineum]